MPRFVRDWFTDEIKEVDVDVDAPFKREVVGDPGETRRVTGAHWGRGWRSNSLAVPVGQVEQFNDDLRKHGVRGAEYDPRNGQLVAYSRSARRDAVRLRGFHDNDGGYGDP